MQNNQSGTAGRWIGAGIVVAMSAVALASHPDETTSAGIYRLPYVDGTIIDVTRDAHNHGGDGGARDRIDMRAVDSLGVPVVTGFAAATGPADVGDPAGLIVAAAPGTIRVIVDVHGDDYGRGDGLTQTGAVQPDDATEHLCTDNAALPAGESCSLHNNYVWIEHANGEWTKYSHPRTGSVSIDRGWSVGDEIEPGDIIGEEGNVGFAFNTHLHFEVAELGAFTGSLPANIGSPGGFISLSLFENHDPRVCDATNDDFRYEGDTDPTTTYTAGECATHPPEFDADPDDVFVTSCTAEREVVLDVPTATDADPFDTVTVTGEVIEINGSPASVDGVGGVFDLPIGVHTVRWTATDDAGLTDEVLQEVTVGSAVTGVDAIRLADRAQATAMLGSYGSTELGADAASLDIYSDGRVFLRNRAVADGDVVATGTVSMQADSVVTGAVTASAAASDLPLPTLDLSVGGPAAGSGSINVNSGDTVVLAPGSHGRVTVNSHGRLVLEAGDHGFRSLIVNQHATLAHAAGATITSERGMTFRGEQEGVGPLPVSITAGGWSHFESAYEGDIFAPRASVRLAGDGGPTYTGQFLARQLLVEADVTVHCVD